MTHFLRLVIVITVLGPQNQQSAAFLKKIFRPFRGCPDKCKDDTVDRVTDCTYRCKFMTRGHYYDGTACWFFGHIGQLFSSEGRCYNGICRPPDMYVNDSQIAKHCRAVGADAAEGHNGPISQTNVSTSSTPRHTNSSNTDVEVTTTAYHSTTSTLSSSDGTGGNNAVLTNTATSLSSVPEADTADIANNSARTKFTLSSVSSSPPSVYTTTDSPTQKEVFASNDGSNKSSTSGTAQPSIESELPSITTTETTPRTNTPSSPITTEITKIDDRSPAIDTDSYALTASGNDNDFSHPMTSTHNNADITAAHLATTAAPSVGTLAASTTETTANDGPDKKSTSLERKAADEDKCEPCADSYEARAPKTEEHFSVNISIYIHEVPHDVANASKWNVYVNVTAPKNGVNASMAKSNRQVSKLPEGTE